MVSQVQTVNSLTSQQVSQVGLLMAQSVALYNRAVAANVKASNAVQLAMNTTNQATMMNDVMHSFDSKALG